ncbi:MAG TPA: DUF6345 domain-containing protein [Gemmatimonadaceae bacterium]|nr:DUF6345 domain-containing protein [Gemmatimonadaceae bacterium]
MARIGGEYINNFDDARATGMFEGAENVETGYYICEWFVFGMQDAGHILVDHHANKGVYERQMRDVSNGGDDAQFTDACDVFLIITHGNYANHELELLFDIEKDTWTGESKEWSFGDRCGLKWLMIYGCQSIDGAHVQEHLHIFHPMHLFCGSYGYMYDSWTVDDAGSNLCDNLTSGEIVSDSWGDAVSDWWVANHPMVLSVERKETYNGGNPDWSTTVIGGDHFLGAGTVMPDIPLNDQYYMATYSWSGGLYDG